MSDPLSIILGVGQLSVLVEIARRMGRLRSDMSNLKGRVQSLEQEVA
jgi:hypothetical protein